MIRTPVILGLAFFLFGGAQIAQAQGTRLVPRAGIAVGEEDKAYMGVYLQAISRAKAQELGFKNTYGSYVKRVIRGTPADRAGLRALDFIYGVDAYRTGAQQSLSDILGRYRAGDQAMLHLYRGPNRTTVNIVFGSRSNSPSVEVSPCQDPFLGVMKQEARPAQGGVVVSIVGNSTADKMGLEDGDEIIRINGYPIIDWMDLTYAINDMEVGEAIKVTVWRGSGRVRNTYAIQSRCDFEKEKARAKVYGRTYSKGAKPPGPEVYFDTRIERQDGRSIISRSVSPSGIQEANRQYGLSLRAENDLAVEEVRFKADFDEEVLAVAFELPGRGPTAVRIFNSEGRKVYDFDLGVFSGSFEDATNLLQNGPGTYFLEVRQGQRSMVRRIELK